MKAFMFIGRLLEKLDDLMAKYLVYSIAIILAIVVMSFSYTITKRENAKQAGVVKAQEYKYLMVQLDKRAVSDCVCSPTEYGWRCIDREEKVYKIRRTQ